MLHFPTLDCLVLLFELMMLLLNCAVPALPECRLNLMFCWIVRTRSGFKWVAVRVFGKPLTMKMFLYIAVIVGILNIRNHYVTSIICGSWIRISLHLLLSKCVSPFNRLLLLFCLWRHLFLNPSHLLQFLFPFRSLPMIAHLIRCSPIFYSQYSTYISFFGSVTPRKC